MHKIVLVDKKSPEYHRWPSLIKKKQVFGFSVDQIVNKYQGFEGDLVFIHNMEEETKIDKKKLEQYPFVKNPENTLLLHVISGDEAMPLFLKKQTFFLGYDVGVCEEEKTIFSSIFHEILFGHLSELTAYQKLLNMHFLFPDRAIADRYVSLHNSLSSQGKDVEDYEEMVIYEIWKDNSYLKN